MRASQFEIEADSLTFIINHVFLPPKLPQKSEVDAGEHNSALLRLCVRAAEDYKQFVSWEVQEAWEPAFKMLENFSRLDNANALDASAFKRAVLGMKPGDVVALHIGAQNAGLMLQQTTNSMIFQSFEVSPLSSEVLKPIGKLRCSYPGPAISVDLRKLKLRPYRLLVELSSFLEKMKRDSTLAPNKHAKGSSTVAEERETADPMFITVLLTGILRGVGEPVEVPRFEKRVGDEVLWNHARIPWRRSPLWLTVKVALQKTLMDHATRAEYKVFMLYLMSSVLELAVESGIASDILFVMNAKLSRRVMKLMDEAGDEYHYISPEILEEAKRVGSMCAQELKNRWERTRKHHSRSLSWSPWELKPALDTSLSMTNSEPYIKWARAWGMTSTKPERKPFQPQEQQRLVQFNGLLPIVEFERITSASSVPEKELALADLELWVRDHLRVWVKGEDVRYIEELGRLIQAYIDCGKQQYMGNPERMSVYFLTLMEMWIAMDLLVITCYPLLAEYSPYFFTDGFLNPILLTEPDQRERLLEVEEYLKARKAKSEKSVSEPIDNMFSGRPTRKSFCVRYFDQNPDYQQLRLHIIGSAEERKYAKRIELSSKMAEQEQLKETAHAMECEYYIDQKKGTQRHQYRCQKCLIIKEAERFRVEVFEWPLPDDDLESKVVVFELMCPRGISVWRDTTYSVLKEVVPSLRQLAAKEGVGAPFEYLYTFVELSTHYETYNQRQKRQQIHWASATKSFLSSHYRFAKLPTDLNSVCVRNSLTFGLFDNSSEQWIPKELGECLIRTECTFTLPEGPYRRLQFALLYSPPSPNQVIARQSECPPEIQLNEYVSFGLVRPGRRIQWLNMLRELRARTLTFNTEAVNMLFTLCAWQSGPPGDTGGVLRAAHTYLQEDPFQRKLLAELISMLDSIKSNWQEAVTARLLITLGVQLLMYCDANTYSRSPFHVEVVTFLKRARVICLEWARELSVALHDCNKPDEMRMMQLRVVQIAVICRETYNVGVEFLPMLLVTQEDFADLIECATLIHDNLSMALQKLEPSIRLLVQRDMRLAHKIEGYFRSMVVKGGVKLDFSRVWESYDANSSSWLALGSPNQRWIVSNVWTKGETYQLAHYNILTGKLLVDGLPLGRMPSNYLSHPVYREILGEKLLDVCPANLLGMESGFQTRRLLEKNRVAFAMDGTDLVVRAKVGTETYHLIPKSKLTGDFPAHIIEEYVFWLHLGSGRIDLRGRDKQWQPSSYPHISSPLESNEPGLRRLRFQPGKQLIDVRSETAKMIHGVLSVLEYETHIEVNELKSAKARPEILARLPRLKLDFVVKDWNLECRQFPQMVVDRNQNLSTFIGLHSKLIVRQGKIRSVMVPYGTVTVHPDGDNHQGVNISTKPKGFDRVRYHIYTIDDTLGRLVGNGSLASHLYKIYLHGVTSSCMPDPLTERTGTEEALALLRCAATWSFQRLERDGLEASILRLIAGLSPQRVYYPKHRKSMQQVTWKEELPPLAQHESFELIVQNVFSHAESFGIFMDGHLDKRYYNQVCDSHLARRAAFRNTKFRRDEFVHRVEQLPGTEKADSIYIARDSQQSPEGAEVYHVARLVEEWATQLSICPNLLDTLVEWGVLDGQPFELGYDERLLELRLADVWLDFQQKLLSSDRQRDTYSLMFTLCTLAYRGSRADCLPLSLVETLLAFATIPSIRELGQPKHTTYDLLDGFEPDVVVLTKLVGNSVLDFAESSEARLDQIPSETDTELAQRRFEEYTNNVQEEVSMFVQMLVSQGPCQSVRIPSKVAFPHIKVQEVEAVVHRKFCDWYMNMEFQQYMIYLQSQLDQINIQKQTPLHYMFNRCERLEPVQDPVPLYQHLLSRPSPRLIQHNVIFTPPGELQAPTPVIPQSDREINDLRSLLKTFAQRSNKDLREFRQQYATDLEKSLDALLSNSDTKSTLTGWSSENVKSSLKLYNIDCTVSLERLSRQIRGALEPAVDERGWMTYKAGLWPQISTVALLQRLAASNFASLSLEWKTVLVEYAMAITALQRAKRLSRAQEQKHDGSDLLRELENIGHEEWDPLENPDWLLMEIENNLLVRSVQATVAKTMIKPPNDKNAIMQLLMGEGKTSVIVPIVATALADSTKLVRVVVLKPLCGQMFQTLVQRLGGLVNRRIFYMPFSRKVNLTSPQVRRVHEIFRECRDMGGILVVQPEHLLSFKLLGLERLHNAERRDLNTKTKHWPRDEEPVAKLLIDVQLWLKENSRDILDESDEILNSRHELIYTIGNSKPMEHHPQRWLVVQELLTLVGSVLRKRRSDPQAFEIGESKYSQYGGFSPIRILDLDEGRRLLEEVAKCIIGSQLPIISFRHWTDEGRTLAVEFITKPRLKQGKMFAVLTRDSDLDDKTLLLLRGLIAHNILLFVLHEKRWKVDYGLDLKRSMLAVPYRAKDSPSGQSEFSHPDVALTLTCLSYYYGGLTENQLEVAFRALFKTDNPTLEYEKWWKHMNCWKDADLKHLNAVNLEDSRQWTERILPIFRYNKAVIDFYLSSVVFPLEAKEFEYKLSSSGWDVAEEKIHPTTGFSGTNDNKYLLPLSITQHDTEKQRNTNASVLSYLLQPGINDYIPIKQENDARLGTIDLLTRLATTRFRNPEPIRVLLDVGAQVLELNNEQVASTWLGLVASSHVKAAVYFNEDDELTVLTKEGVKEPVLISAFAERLDDCIVYLDEAHTRGTDLKLPPSCRAAVTLGPNLTKDRLVQACMRMRKLRSGHSVIFCGPPEIDRELHKFAAMRRRDRVEVRDVIYWSMQQTCYNTRKLVPIWAKQGMSYHQRSVASKELASGFPEALLEREAKTLEQHYGFERSQTADFTSGPLPTDGAIKEILEQCAKFGVKSSAGAPMLEEQERELCHEIESERESERPPPAEARKHRVTTHLRTFIESGQLPGLKLRQDAFLPAFDVLLNTAAAEHMQRGAWPQTLLVTTDFANTVEIRKRNKGMDDYLMLVNWVVSTRADPSVLIILSPWEVNSLISRIRVSETVTLHMYAPRTTKASPSYNKLDYYTLPPVSHDMPLTVPTHSPVIDLLGLFSGELYFEDYASYERICGFLGLYFKDVPAQKEGLISPDGHVKSPEARNILGMPLSPFERSPLPLLRILIGLRRKGQSYLSTHVGCMLHGRQLRKEDVEERLVSEVNDDGDDEEEQHGE
ncbi:hypothetical protein BGX38DRAFT_1171611 [Terfezia claveryi]|nr:hypothetical protein BGX38DRAFT_1171611 [Terfezia claveryi]